jgi:hypothetical protein
MEMNVENSKAIRILRQSSAVQIKLENVKQINYMGSVITNDARCTRDIKSRVAMAKPLLEKNNTLFTSKLKSKLRN